MRWLDSGPNLKIDMKDNHKDVLLINPCWGYPINREGKRFNRLWPPISLANAAGLLEREGFKVSILDGNLERLNSIEIAKSALNFDKVFVTSSPLDRWQCPSLDIEPVLEIFHELKNDKKYLIGAHGTLLPEKMLNLTESCAVVIGEPEKAILELCKEDDLSGIDGICYKKDGKVVRTKDRDLLNLDELPMPAYHLLQNKRYFYELLGNNFTLFESSRGCPFECIFCLKVMYGKGVRFKSIDKLRDEVRYAVQKSGVRNGYFIDLEWSLNRDRAEGICDFLIRDRYNLKWCCQTRADTVDKELLKRMKRAGCHLIHFGVETGSEKVLERLNKRISLGKVEEAVRSAGEAGIETACFFLFGFPGETDNDRKKTVEFAKNLNCDYASFHTVTPYYGTRLFNEVANGSSISKDEEAFFIDNSLLGDGAMDLNKITHDAFCQFYLRPSYIFKKMMQLKPGTLISGLRLLKGYLRSYR